MVLGMMMALGGMLCENAPVEGGGGGSGSPPAPPPPQAAPPAPPQAPPQAQVPDTDWVKKVQAAEQARIKAENELKASREASLTETQKIQAQLEALTKAHHDQQEQIAQARREQEVERQRARLSQYRADLLLQWGPDRLPAILHAQVVGNTEGEIYASAKTAADGYAVHIQAMRAQFQPQALPQALPPNPHVPVPQAQVPGGPAQGYPTAMQGSAPPPPRQVDVRALTSEQAVRTGKYAATRDALIQALQQGVDPATLNPAGNQQAPAPQGMAPAIQYENMAGQQQPRAAPMAQVIPAHLQPKYLGQPQQQAPQAQPMPPQAPAPQAPPAGEMDFRAAAMAAAERTRQGLNPMVAQNEAGAAHQLSQLRNSQFAGANPIDEFNKRFTATPPAPPSA